MISDQIGRTGIENEMKIEKRKNARFLVRKNVILALKNGMSRVGKVKDIGRGGLSFEHIHDEELNRGDSGNHLFLWADDFRISKIPCRIIYELIVPRSPEYDSFTLHLVTRRCGVQFETLTESQISQLELFLTTYTREKTG